MQGTVGRENFLLVFPLKMTSMKTFPFTHSVIYLVRDQQISERPIVSYCLFLYGLQTKHNFYIFKWGGRGESYIMIYEIQIFVSLNKVSLKHTFIYLDIIY